MKVLIQKYAHHGFRRHPEILDEAKICYQKLLKLANCFVNSINIIHISSSWTFFDTLVTLWLAAVSDMSLALLLLWDRSLAGKVISRTVSHAFVQTIWELDETGTSLHAVFLQPSIHPLVFAPPRRMHSGASHSSESTSPVTATSSVYILCMAISGDKESPRRVIVEEVKLQFQLQHYKFKLRNV